MRILVTGADGFVGRWLLKELEQAGHVPIPAPPIDQLDVADAKAVEALLRSELPDGVAHLAGVAFAPDAEEDPGLALRTNVGGTLSVVEAGRMLEPRPALLVVGSADVYAHPECGQPLTESSRLGPRNVYGHSKLGAEGVTLWGAMQGLRAVVARSFNHTGPGQRHDFVVPAMAGRIAAAKRDGRDSIRVGNVDVARDIGDVRDTVRAYRLMLEHAAADEEIPQPPVFNVATGHPVKVRDIIDHFSRSVDWPVEFDLDPSLLRASDPELIVGDAQRLHDWVGWSPAIPFETTLSDVLQEVTKA